MFDGNVALVLDLEELIRNYQDKRMAPPPK
jgi:chemotaxis protein histidine kinase CheA